MIRATHMPNKGTCKVHPSRVKIALNYACRLGDRRDDVTAGRSLRGGGGPGPGPAAGRPPPGRGRRGVLPAAAQLLHHVALPAPPHLHLLSARPAQGRSAHCRHGKMLT